MAGWGRGRGWKTTAQIKMHNPDEQKKKKKTQNKMFTRPSDWFLISQIWISLKACHLKVVKNKKYTPTTEKNKQTAGWDRTHGTQQE